MNSKNMHHLNIDFIKPAVAVFIAYGVSLTDVTDIVKLLSAGVALCYGIWKWSKDAKK